MQLVEQHVIKPNSPHWQAIDDAAFAAKNLYNLANYTVRQETIKKRGLGGERDRRLAVGHGWIPALESSFQIIVQGLRTHLQ